MNWHFPLCLSFSLAGQPPLVSNSHGSKTATRTTRGIDAEPNDCLQLDSWIQETKQTRPDANDTNASTDVDEIEQAFTAWPDMSAVLDIVGRPIALSRCVVPLIKQRIESLKDKRFILRFHRLIHFFVFLTRHTEFRPKGTLLGCFAAVHEVRRTRDERRLIGRQKDDGLSYLFGCPHSFERHLRYQSRLSFVSTGEAFQHPRVDWTWGDHVDAYP